MRANEKQKNERNAKWSMNKDIMGNLRIGTIWPIFLVSWCFCDMWIMIMNRLSDTIEYQHEKQIENKRVDKTKKK